MTWLCYINCFEVTSKFDLFVLYMCSSMGGGFGYTKGACKRHDKGTSVA